MHQHLHSVYCKLTGVAKAVSNFFAFLVKMVLLISVHKGLKANNGRRFHLTIVFTVGLFPRYSIVDRRIGGSKNRSLPDVQKQCESVAPHS